MYIKFKKVFISLLAVLVLAPSQALAMGDSMTGKIASGHSSVFVVMDNGDLVGWGKIGGYDINLGEPKAVNTPIKIMDNVAYVSAGYKHFAAIKKDGTLWMWGENSNYQVGNDSTEYQDEPVQVLNKVSKVSTGINHTLAVKTDGTVWGWGLNQNGAVDGGSKEKFIKTPAKISVLASANTVSAGGSHSLAVVGTQVYGWGWNFVYQLGLNHSADVFAAKPIRAGTFASAGIDQSMILSSLKAYSAGSNAGFKTSPNTGFTTNKLFKTPNTAVPSNVKTMSTSWKHSMVVTSDGKLYAIGNNDSGQLGLNSSQSVTKYTAVPGLSNVTDVAVGYLNSVILLENNDVLVSGLYNDAAFSFEGNVKTIEAMSPEAAAEAASDMTNAKAYSGAVTVKVNKNGSIFTKILNLSEDAGQF